MNRLGIAAMVVAAIWLAQWACTLAQPGADRPKQARSKDLWTAHRYSDDDVEAFIRRLPALLSKKSDSPISEAVIEELGIDLNSLAILERHIGDCFDIYIYDLSPSYVLFVDRNACFGFQAAIDMKEQEGSFSPDERADGHEADLKF